MDTIEVTFVNGPEAGRKIQISDRPLTFGRTTAADVVMNWDGAVSSKHFVIAREAGAFFLTDLQSTNGTRVNNVSVKRHQLQHGDRIQTGNTQSLVAISRVDQPLPERRTPPLGTLVPNIPAPTPAERRFTNPIESSVIDFASDRANKAVGNVDASNSGEVSPPPAPGVNPRPAPPLSSMPRRDSHPIEESFPIDPRPPHCTPPTPSARVRPATDLQRESERNLNSNPIDGSIVDFQLPDEDAVLDAADTSDAIDGPTPMIAADTAASRPQVSATSNGISGQPRPSEMGVPRRAIIRQVRLRIAETPDQSAPARLMWLGPGQMLSFGRSYSCDCSIAQDNTLSSRHFEVRCNEQICQVIDMGSLGGTWLNGQRVTTAALYDGDQLLAGRTHFSVEVETSNGVLQRPQGESAEASVGQAAASAPSTQAIAATKIQCPSGLYLLRGTTSAGTSLTPFVKAFHNLGKIYLLLDFGRFDLPYPAVLDIETTKLFHWLPAAAALRSLHLFELSELANWPEYLDQSEGADAALVLLGDQSKAELLAGLQENLRDPTRGGEVFHGILGYCWPSVLTALLEQGTHGLAERLFEQITAVVTEARPPYQWQFFARDETKGSKILANCKRAGLSISIAPPK